MKQKLSDEGFSCEAEALSLRYAGFQRGYWDKLSFLKQHGMPIAYSLLSILKFFCLQFLQDVQ